MTYTSVSTYTQTHTATHLADVILGSIADILGTLGIDATRVFADWDTRQQSAISAWIEEGLMSIRSAGVSSTRWSRRSHLRVSGLVHGYRRRRPEVYRRPCRASPVPCQASNSS